MADIKQEVFEIVSQELGVSAGDLSLETKVETLTDGDELATSDLLMALEDHFGFEFEAENASSAKTIGDLVGIVSRASQGS